MKTKTRLKRKISDSAKMVRPKFVGSIIHRVAAIYPTMSDVIDELIQNALDANATKIHLKVAIGRRFISIRDNGEGIKKDKFETVVENIGRSMKADEKLGQFGIGFVSPVGKCDHIKITSCPEGKIRGYNECILEIHEDDEHVVIDPVYRGKIVFDPDRGNAGSGAFVWWRTAIEVFDYTEDKAMSEISLGGIVDNIRMKYSNAMARYGTKIIVEVQHPDGTTEKENVAGAMFKGRRLEKFNVNLPNSGKVSISMYLANRSEKRRGVNVKFGEMDNDFRFPFSNFAVSTAKSYLSSEAMAALGSGVFEGEILAENVKLSASRTCFLKNDALEGLCEAVEEWFQTKGKECLDTAKRDQKEERYQKLGIKSITHLDEIIRSNPELSKALKQFSKGTAGTGHSGVSGNKKQKERSMSNRGGAGKKRTNPEGGKKSDSDETQKRPKPLDVNHLSVKGPKGSQRKIVTGGSQGLQYDHKERPDSTKLWELDMDIGVIVFNTMHEDWVLLDSKGGSDWKICALMELVTLEALTLLAMDDVIARAHQRKYADALIHNAAQWLNRGGGNIRRKL